MRRKMSSKNSAIQFQYWHAAANQMLGSGYHPAPGRTPGAPSAALTIPVALNRELSKYLDSDVILTYYRTSMMRRFHFAATTKAIGGTADTTARGAP